MNKTLIHSLYTLYFLIIFFLLLNLKNHPIIIIIILLIYSLIICLNISLWKSLVNNVLARKYTLCLYLRSCLFSGIRLRNYNAASKSRVYIALQTCFSLTIVSVAPRKIESDRWLRDHPVHPHKDIINASQSRCGAERIASIKCNFKRVSILNFG